MRLKFNEGLRGATLGVHRFRRILFSSIIILTAFTAYGFALDPDQPAASYLRSNFTAQDGLINDVVNAIVQTRNGLVWLGTGAGLMSFNGHRFLSIQVRNWVVEGRPVEALAVTPDGDLWVGSVTGLVRIPSAALNHYDLSLSTLYHPGEEITCLHVSRDGI